MKGKRIRTEEQKARFREYYRKWRALNADSIRAYAVEWRKKNPERIKEITRGVRARRKEKRRAEWRAWAARNKATLTAKAKARRHANPEQFNARKRALYIRNRKKILAANARWQKAHPEIMRKHKSAYSKKYPEKILAQVHKRRARLHRATVSDCSETISALRKIKKCSYCCEEIMGTTQVDHVVPISRGGRHAPDNLAPSCLRCNSSKGTKLLSEWKPEQYREAA